MTTATKTKTTAAATGDLYLVDYKDIKLGENSRTTLTDIEDLAESIAFAGLLNPLSVDSEFNLKAGYRRHAALGQLIKAKRWTGQIPVMVSATDEVTSDIQHLIENLQRVDLDPVDEAFGFQKLATTHGMKAEDIAAHVRRSVPHVKDRITLTKLPDWALEQVRTGRLQIQHAVKMTKLNEDSLAKLAKKSNVNSYDVEDLIRAEAEDRKRAPFVKHLDGWKIERYATAAMNKLMVQGDIKAKDLPGVLDRIGERDDQLAIIDTFHSPATVRLYYTPSEADAAVKAEIDAAREAEVATEEATEEAERAELLAQLTKDERKILDDAIKQSLQYHEDRDVHRQAIAQLEDSWLVSLTTKEIAGLVLRDQARKAVQSILPYRPDSPKVHTLFGITEDPADWAEFIAAKPERVAKAALLALDYHVSSVLRDAKREVCDKAGLVEPTQPKFTPPKAWNTVPEDATFTFRQLIDLFDSKFDEEAVSIISNDVWNVAY